jgi:hypothetical protein
MHPRIWFPEAHALGGNEVRFFDVHLRHGLDWYKRIMTPLKPDRLVADVSPGYARIPAAPIRVCAELSPAARVFHILRTLIGRDWSSLLMQAERRGYDPEKRWWRPMTVSA